MKIDNVYYDLLAGLLRKVYDLRISGAPVLEAAEHFPESQSFIGSWQSMQKEALNIAKNLAEVPRFHELMKQQADISANDQRDWRMFVIKAYGVDFPENAARCPAIADLVERNPSVLTATISFLAPYKHIPEHRGPFRGVIRYYLGLSVPLASDGLPATELIVDGKVHRVANGECLLWDDTYPHEVRNAAGEMRIALLLDIRRHGMPFDMEVLSGLIVAAIGMVIRLKRMFGIKA